ncbi:MAG: N-acetylmuramoyl-L-alanine amidase [Candidatus Latescibacteria bacterium]|nr:N-acetylmuramoyl-L-alanine amidase [Candidatus Latescibacterota bacterium]
MRGYFSGLVLLAGVLSGVSSGWCEPVTICYTDGRPSAQIEAIDREGICYGSLVGLAHTFGASLYWAPLTGKMVFKLGEGEIKITTMNPTVIVDDLVFNFPLVPVLEEGAVYVPMRFFTLLLDRISPEELSWNPLTRTLLVKPMPTNLSVPQIEERENGTLVTIPASVHFDQIQDTISEPSWLHLSIYGGKLDQTAWASVQPKGAVNQIRTYQYRNSAQISLLLEKGVTYRVYQKENPNRIVVLLRKSSEQTPTFSLKRESLDPKLDQTLWAIDTVVIDPGHGGVDPGAVGPTGLKEKDAVLDIALRLKKLLEQRLHLRVVLTRDKDIFIPLQQRARIANQANGKLFISIHANAGRRRSAHGTETYFLSEAKTEDAMRVAQRENASIRFEESANSIEEIDTEDFLLRDVKAILTEMVSNRFLKESQDLAAIIQAELVKQTGLKNLGVKQAGFYVMLGTEATMPSVLVEVAFISNPREEKLLKTRRFRQKVAEAMYRAVKNFKQKQEQALGSSPTTPTQ